MKLKQFLYNFIIIFLMTSTFTVSVIGNTFALVDIPTSTIYNVRVSDGENKFESRLPKMSPLLYNGGNADPTSCSANRDGGIGCKINGDLSLELRNPFCISYIALYSLAMYAGNSAVKKTATASLLIAALSIYTISLQKNQTIEICGADWLVWGNSSEADSSALKNIREYYPERGAFKNSRKYQVESCLRNISECDSQTKDFMARDGKRTSFNINDKVYRERLYDGEEVENKNCTDPREERKNYDVGGKSQLYYMRGYDRGNYVCDRFLIDKVTEGDKFDQAYKCCIEASNSLCIRDKGSIFNNASFCNVNQSKCWLNGIEFEIFKGDKEQGKYCARSFSLCPYNFNIQKGSEKTLSFSKKIDSNGNVEDECYDKDNERSLPCQNKIKNFYQYNRHCTIVEKWVEESDFNDQHYAPFIDKACINFIGSSHNTTGYLKYTGYRKRFNDYKSFTAPMAECFSETMKNFLYNRAGHIKCKNSNEIPDIYGNCTSGIQYREGDNLETVEGIETPTSRLLKYIHNLIMLTLTIMIVLYGYNILINTGKIDRKGMMIMFLKVVIVVTFSANTWWYEQLFRFTYGLSGTLSRITGRIEFDTTKDPEFGYIKYDGCYFGNTKDLFDSQTGEVVDIENNNYREYPASRSYISFFDSIDCKVTKYLGYAAGISKSVPGIINLLSMSLIFPFNIGLFIAVGTFMLALFAINFAIKALYIFVASSIAMAIMLYVAPIIIPCILFKKTKGIFDKWLKNLLSFALQPMILFAYVSIALLIMDKYTLGEGIMTGKGPNRELICGYSCIDGETDAILDYTSKRGKNTNIDFSTRCGNKNVVIDLKRNSVLCFINNLSNSPISFLQPLGLFIPLIVDIFLSDVIMFLRVAFLFFILTKVLNSIPSIASSLTGGIELKKSDLGDPFQGARKIFNFSNAIKRGSGSAVKKGYNALKGKLGKGNDNKDTEKRGDAVNNNSKKTGE